MSLPFALPMPWLRSVAETFLPDVAAIERYTETNGPDGVVQDWVTIATGVPCRVARSGTNATERSGVEGGTGGGVVRALSEWEVWAPYDTDVTERDRITVTFADHATSRTYEVQRSAPTSYETQRQCLCTLVS